MFFIFSAWVRGMGDSGATGRGGWSVFFVENPRKGGSPRARGPGGCLPGIWGGGGVLNILLSYIIGDKNITYLIFTPDELL